MESNSYGDQEWRTLGFTEVVTPSAQPEVEPGRLTYLSAQLSDLKSVSNPEVEPRVERVVVDNNTAPKRTRGHRISGAEQKRRKKAKQLALLEAAIASGVGSGSSLPMKEESHKSIRARPDATASDPRKNPRINRIRSNRSASASTSHARHEGTSSKPITYGRYREPHSSHLRVAIVNRRDCLGKVSTELAAFIQTHLKQKLREALAHQETIPAFDKWSHTGMILRVSCKDDAALIWLVKAIGELPPFDRAILEVTRENDLPKLKKVSLFIPDEKLADIRTVLELLAGQNPRLQIKSWPIFHSEDKADGFLIVAGASEKDAEEILEMGGRIYFGLSTVKVRMSAKAELESLTTLEEDVKDIPFSPFL